MSEWDVIEWLTCKRIEGNEYYTINEIHKGLSDSGISNGDSYIRTTRRKTWNLFSKHFLDKAPPKDLRNWRDWSVKFRLKKKYINNVMVMN